MAKSRSLRAQLIGLSLMVAMLALASAGTVLFFLDRANAREQLTQELTSTARQVANRSSTALVFLDDLTAQEKLDALRGLQQVGLVCLFDMQPKLFASFSHDGDSAQRCRELTGDSGDAHNIVRVKVPVIAKDVPAGSLVIVSTTKPLTERMWGQLISLGAALGIAFSVASVIALGLQRSIVQPIAKVRDVAVAVMDTKDFSLRAPDQGSHEVGRLANAFNAMLNTIEGQNRNLAQSEAYARRLFHDSPISQLVLDARTGLCIDCNQAAVSENGFSQAPELIGKSLVDISAPTQAKGFAYVKARDFSANQLRKSGAVSGEWRFQRPAGDVWEGLVHAMLFALNGRELVHVSVQDITQRKRAEDALNQLNQELESRVQSRTSELASSNTSLSQALATLKHAQSELLQKDKLASLGALVAGVAHELNTPLGNSILVATSLELNAQTLGAEMQAGTLTKSGAAQKIAQLEQGTALLIRNLQRSSELIVNFKQVAVDQTSEKRRTFQLDRVIREVVETLQPQFKHTPHTVHVDVAAGFTMDSYPGPLGQVITNLVLNSLIHAFDKTRPGTMRVHAEKLGETAVRLTVEDDGCGIPSDHLTKVFDPFFTTKLGQGGSGLGLNIVYNIVVSTLGGEIHVSSEEGKGTVFSLDIPLVAPGSATATTANQDSA